MHAEGVNKPTIHSLQLVISQQPASWSLSLSLSISRSERSTRSARLFMSVVPPVPPVLSRLIGAHQSKHGSLSQTRASAISHLSSAPFPSCPGRRVSRDLGGERQGTAHEISVEDGLAIATRKDGHSSFPLIHDPFSEPKPKEFWTRCGRVRCSLSAFRACSSFKF